MSWANEEDSFAQLSSTFPSFMKTPLAKIGIVWMVLLLTLNQVKAEELTRIFHASQSAVWPKPMDTVLGSNSDRSGMYSYSSAPKFNSAWPHQPSRPPRHESYEISGLGKQINA